MILFSLTFIADHTINVREESIILHTLKASKNYFIVLVYILVLNPCNAQLYSKIKCKYIEIILIISDLLDNLLYFLTKIN